MTKVRTKKELANILGVSASTLRRWMNGMYYDQLSALGYDKRERILKPKILQFLCKQLDIEL